VEDDDRWVEEYRGTPTWDVERCCWRPATRLFWPRSNTFIANGAVYTELFTGRFAASWAMPGAFPQPPYGSWAPVTLAGGYVVTMTCKYQVEDQDVNAVFQIDSATLGGIVLTSSNYFSATAPALDNVTFADGVTRLIFDARLKTPTGGVFTLDEGFVVVPPTATRAIT
jgi:hypothetical protein